MSPKKPSKRKPATRKTTRKPAMDTRKKPGPKKGEGGRPPAIEITPDLLQKVEAMAGLGLTQGDIATILGIDARTFRNHKTKNAELDSAYKEGVAKARLLVTNKLRDKIKSGNVAAIIFYIKTQMQWRENSRVELTGPDGGPVQVMKIGDEEIEF